MARTWFKLGTGTGTALYRDVFQNIYASNILSNKYFDHVHMDLAALAQSAARSFHNLNVVGSIPPTGASNNPIFSFKFCFFFFKKKDLLNLVVRILNLVYTLPG